MASLRLKENMFKLMLFFIIMTSLQGCEGNKQKLPFHQLNDDKIFHSGPVKYNDYKLMPGDQLDIKFYYHPELNGQVEIRPDGRISIPMAEEIQAHGLTVQELDSILTEEYSKELTDPVVTVIVRRFNQRKYFISGEVGTPGEMEFTQSTTILQVLASVGGLKDTGDDTNILLIRSDSENKPIFIIIDYDELLSNPYENFYLRPYDVIFVSRTVIADIGVFVDQYINKIVPESLGFSFLYGVGGAAGAVF